MKTIRKSQYNFLKLLQKHHQDRQEVIEISDEEYEELQQYVHKPITIIDNPEEFETYTITFKNGYEIIKTVTGVTGTYVSAPNITKEGYEFKGWSIDGTTVTIPVNIISNSNITYIALWAEQEEPIEPQEETYDYLGCDFGVNGLGYNIISLEDKTVSIVKYCDNRKTLTEAIIPENVEYNNILFSVTSIDYNAFIGCNNLTYIDIPNSVTIIGSYAFEYCGGLTSCTIGNGVTYIGHGVFKNCTSLTSIVIPNSVTSIGNDVFQYCDSLISCTIGSSVTSIGDAAFQFCTNLTSINIPNGVTSISRCTFYDCTSLTSIVIPSGVTSIGDYAFTRCSSLTSIVIPDSVTSIGDSAFSGCSGLTTCTIGSGVTSISKYAFSNCSNLTSMTIYRGDIINLNIDHQITIYVLSELVNDYKSHYEKDIFVGKVNILPIE